MGALSDKSALLNLYIRRALKGSSQSVQGPSIHAQYHQKSMYHQEKSGRGQSRVRIERQHLRAPD